MIERIILPSMPAPRFRYSQCVRMGSTVMLSGMIALDAQSGALAEGGPEQETAKILRNLKLALADLGLTLADVAVARIFTTRFEDFPLINRAWEAVFDADTPPPARTAVGVVALPLGATVEIEFQLYDTGKTHD